MRTKLYKISAAALGLALALTFSCSSDGDAPCITCEDGNQSSSSSFRSSSNSVGKSSNSAEVTSSSSKPGGSSSAVKSSSSVIPSSSSVIPSSSSVIPSSSSAIPSSSSSSAIPSSSSAISSSSSVPIQSGVIRGTPVTYEGETYETVVIGTQTWMARNLNYAVAGSKCGGDNLLFDANTPNCDIYGRLYDWATAMGIDAKYNLGWWNVSGGDVKHRGICPIGWHIPNIADWGVLMKFINPSCTDFNFIGAECAGAGAKLKAKSGWSPSFYDGTDSNGTDDYGFSALPGGYGEGRNFNNYGAAIGYWWSAKEDHRYAYHIRMRSDDGAAGTIENEKGALFSVRCVKD